MISLKELIFIEMNVYLEIDFTNSRIVFSGDKENIKNAKNLIS